MKNGARSEPRQEHSLSAEKIVITFVPWVRGALVVVALQSLHCASHASHASVRSAPGFSGAIFKKSEDTDLADRGH